MLEDSAGIPRVSGAMRLPWCYDDDDNDTDDDDNDDDDEDVELFNELINFEKLLNTEP